MRQETLGTAFGADVEQVGRTLILSSSIHIHGRSMVMFRMHTLTLFICAYSYDGDDDGGDDV